MNSAILAQPTRTPFNPHGFTDATPLHNFYLELLAKGLIDPDLEEGNLEFGNSSLFMNIDWEVINLEVENQYFNVKADIECGVILVDQRITNKIELFLNDTTLYIVAAKTFNPKNGLTQSLNLDIPLRVLNQMGYYKLPLKED